MTKLTLQFIFTLLVLISSIYCMAVRSKGTNENKTTNSTNLKPITTSTDADDLYYDICDRKDDLIIQKEYSTIKCLSKASTGKKCIETITGMKNINSPSKFRTWFCTKNNTIENYEKLQSIGSQCRVNISTELESVVSDCEVDEDARLAHIDICINKNEDTAKARFAVIKCTIEIGGKNGTECVEKTLDTSPPPKNHTAFAKWYCESHNISSEHTTGVSDALVEDCEFEDPTWIEKIEQCVDNYTETLESSAGESSGETADTSASVDDSGEESADEPIAIE